MLKGAAMGAANVIPGVSGGTIAFITGIYEKLISSLKSLDVQAVKLFFTGKWRSLAKHISLDFLFFLFLGVAISILSLAKAIKWAFEYHEILTLSFFFGLIIASIFGVGKQLTQINIGVVLSFLIGVAIAVGIAFLPPASANDSMLYIFLCGVVAVCSMVLPGLSGSYILLLMGNYLLVMTAIGDLDLGILAPLMVGVLVGLVLFSRLLSWLFKHFKNITIALLTGFVAGSLLIIWPWKHTQTALILGKEKAVGYEWYLPPIDSHFLMAAGLIVVGFLLVFWLEKTAPKSS